MGAARCLVRARLPGRVRPGALPHTAHSWQAEVVCGVNNAGWQERVTPTSWVGAGACAVQAGRSARRRRRGAALLAEKGRSTCR